MNHSRIAMLALTHLKIVAVIMALLPMLMTFELSAQTSPLPTIVSTHLCADQLALSLATPEQILSLSYKSQDPKRSRFAARAQSYPANIGSSEEIIRLKPDVVLASRRWRHHPQKKQFDALGINIVIVPSAKSWPDIFQQTQWLAEQIGRPQQGRELLAQVRQRLQNLQQSVASSHAEQPSILYLRPNGGSAGQGTYIDTLIKTLGYRNHASVMGLRGWGHISLEKLMLNPPDYFLLSQYVRDKAFAKSQLSRHPLLQKLLQSRPIITLPTHHGSCANWQIIETAEYLREKITGYIDKKCINHCNEELEQVISQGKNKQIGEEIVKEIVKERVRGKEKW